MRGKKIRVISAFVFGFVAAWALSGNHAFGAEKGTLYAGTAKVNVTPKTPVPMSGYGSRKDPFKGVHDDIFARAVVFGDGVRKAAVISVDVIGFSHDFWKKITERLERETGIEQKYIRLSP